MRHLHTPSHFRHALFVLQDADGYVDALLEMARDQVTSRRSTGTSITFGNRPKNRQPDLRNSANLH
jgi:hypothetical protein